ncbi:photosystem II q(b) protein, partial [Nodularia spumigena UHCC 0060]|nr:photosystem II q(b) protein [Nodularia spumigena UHCC 0060]
MFTTGRKTYLIHKNNRNHKNMTTTLQQRQSANVWDRFCEWITSTDNRI